MCIGPGFPMLLTLSVILSCSKHFSITNIGRNHNTPVHNIKSKDDDLGKFCGQHSHYKIADTHFDTMAVAKARVILGKRRCKCAKCRGALRGLFFCKHFSNLIKNINAWLRYIPVSVGSNV